MVTYYSLKVFRQANVSIDKHILSLLVPSGVVIGFLISSVLLSKIKRKLHFSLATILMTVSLTALGFSLQTNVRFTLHLRYLVHMYVLTQ